MRLTERSEWTIYEGDGEHPRTLAELARDAIEGQ
jgi:hypothetical protein